MAAENFEGQAKLIKDSSTSKSRMTHKGKRGTSATWIEALHFAILRIDCTGCGCRIICPTGLKELNDRLSGAHQGSRYTLVDVETCLVLEVLRAALLDYADEESNTTSQTFLTAAIKIWPYALALEQDDPLGITRQKLLGFTSSQEGT